MILARTQPVGHRVVTGPPERIGLGFTASLGQGRSEVRK